MDWKDLATEVEKIGLPLLGAVLPIPGGAAIGAALASHIGGQAVSGKPEDILAALTQSADALQKAREFELTHQQRMLEITTAAETRKAELEASDRDSARKMQMETKSRMPAVLGGIAIVTFAGMLIALWRFGLPQDQAVAGVLLMAFGQMRDEVKAIYTFVFGHTASSERKDAVIQTMAKS